MDGSEARVTKMNEYDVQMASTGSASEAPGDYSKRMRDKKIMLAQYPGPDQGTAKQNRTEQTKAQKQEKHTRTDKALSAEQAADFGMWQQSSAAPAC